MSKKMSKNYNFDIFLHLPKFTPLPFLNFGMNPKFDHIPPTCILLKLHYAKFDVSRFFCSKVIKEKPLGGSARPPPPLVKEGLNNRSLIAKHEIPQGQLLATVFTS